MCEGVQDTSEYCIIRLLGRTRKGAVNGGGGFSHLFGPGSGWPVRGPMAPLYSSIKVSHCYGRERKDVSESRKCPMPAQSVWLQLSLHRTDKTKQKKEKAWPILIYSVAVCWWW